jgi:hypothetical protein
MLKPSAPAAASATARSSRRRPAARALARLSLVLVTTIIANARAAQASWGADILPLLAQAQKATTTAEPAAAEGGSWPVLDWLIVVALIGGALYAICRSSRRN